MKSDPYMFLIDLLSKMYNPLVIEVYEDRIRQAALFLNDQWDSDIWLVFDRDFHWKFGRPNVADFTHGPNVVIKVQHYISEYLD